MVVSACGGGDGGTLTRAQLLDPQTCATCHPVHYREWSGSMHAYAGEDPVFLAMNKRAQRETGGALGPFCVRCHAPMALAEGATTDGLNLPQVPRHLRGVTCFFCHSVVAVEGTHNNPLRLASDLVMRGGFADARPNPAHRSAYSSLHDRDRAESSALCGSCHDVVTPAGVKLERTFLEWQASVFSGPRGATCGQCHMEQGADLAPIATGAGMPARKLHGHGMPAVDVALTDFPERENQRRRVQRLLDSTLQSALCVVQNGDSFALRVLLDNVGAGHGFPSGASADRRLWAEVVAYEGSRVLYQSGVVPDGTPAVAIDDPDLWLMRDCLFDDAGHEVHMFWDARSYESNTLPTLQTLDPLDPRFYATHIVQEYPRKNARFLTGTPDRVTLRVRLQPIGLDVLDSLVQSGDLDRSVRDAMPTFDIGQTVEWTPSGVNGRYFEGNLQVRCVTRTNHDVTGDKVPAAVRSRCR